MEELMQILPVTLYMLAIVLVIVLIVLGIRLIQTLDRVNMVVDDIERKSKSLNGLFNVIDVVTDSLSLLSDTVVESITSGISRLFQRKKKKKKEKEIDEDE